MDIYLIRAVQFILSLSILILTHELGHFIFAKLFKTRVEKFYLFFDIRFSLFKFKPKNSDTEYGLGWLPLGGYCKISGMVDESLDREQLAQPPKPYEFRSKSAWQRLLIMTAGVIFNFLLALVIYSMILFQWGDAYIPLDKVTCGMEYSDTFHDIGFKDGDILLKADGIRLERFNEAAIRQIFNASAITVSRNGTDTLIHMPNDIMQRMLKSKQGFANYRVPMVVNKVESKIAINAGLQSGDKILGVNGVQTPLNTDVHNALYANRGMTVPFEIERAGQTIELNLPIDTIATVGFRPKKASEIYETVRISYGFFESIPAGITLGVNTLKGYISDMKYVFTKEGAKSLGGFGAIINMFPPVWDWRLFWERTAFLSIILAFMNILPIPALDGGHVLFLLVEVITRRKPSDKFLEYAQIAGMVILFSILIYANGNDVLRFFGK